MRLLLEIFHVETYIKNKKRNLQNVSTATLDTKLSKVRVFIV